MLVTDKERFRGMGIFIGHPSWMLALWFNLNYSFITETLNERKVKHISFVKEHLQSYLGYYVNKPFPRESH